MTNGRVQFISQVPLFQGLPERQLVELTEITVERSFAKGDPVFFEGDEGNGFYVITSGKIRIFKVSPEGKEQILHMFGPGEPFGEVPVFEGGRFPANAEALESCSLLFFPRRDFVRLIEKNPSLALNMLAVLSRRLRFFTRLVDDLSLKEVPGRLAAHLLNLSSRNGLSDLVELDMAKTHLASLLGTIPETLSRILSRLVKSELIEMEGPRIRILDRENLEHLAETGKGLV